LTTPEPRTTPEIDSEVERLMEVIYRLGVRHMAGMDVDAEDERDDLMKSISRRLAAQSAGSVTVDRERIAKAIRPHIEFLVQHRDPHDFTDEFVENITNEVMNVIAAMGQEPGEA
jgi:hypothetical protein